MDKTAAQSIRRAHAVPQLMLPARCTRLLLVGFALIWQGCSTPPVQTPVTVTLPLARTNVADRREQFAAAFERELTADGYSSYTVTAWLALPPDARLLTKPPLPPAAVAAHTSVLIAPGIFGDCVAMQSLPFSDGVYRPGTENYVNGYRTYDSLGLQSLRAVQLRGRASSATNGDLLARALLEEQARPEVQSIVLVAYSKGVPDALHAMDLLEREKRFPSKLKALVSVAGVVNGTVIADRNRELYEALADRFNPLDCTPSEGGEVESLTKEVRLAWLETHPLPKSVRPYSIVARASADTVAPGLVVTFRQLSVLGDRNDGQVLVSDAILPGSSLLAEVFADHWKFILPLEAHPSALVRGLVNDQPFPRAPLFRAVISVVLSDIASSAIVIE